MKRVLSLLAVVAIIFTGCKNTTSFTVKGTLKGTKEKYIYLNRLDVSTPVFIDSAKISASGKFSFKVKSGEPEFYQLGFTNKDFVTIIAAPGDRINLKFEGKKLPEKYSVSGSEESEKIRILDNNLMETRRRLDSLSTIYTRESSLAGFDKRGPELEEQFRAILKEQRKKNINFIINNTKSFSSIKAVYQKVDDNTYVLYDSKDLQYLKIITDSLTKYYPESKQVKALASNFSREMSQMYSNKLQAMTKDLPETKLNPDLTSINGKRIALSSLRGKYVLLAFWSAKSQQCLQENLQLKDYYKKYSNRGFEIYQINLDQNEADWRAAVKFDELPWINTREDDSTNFMNARLYNVQGVPTNYLYDKEGNIIARDLHGKALQIKLQQLFN